MRLAFLLGFVCVALLGQAPPEPVMTNTGKPIQFPFTCGAAEIEQFTLSCTSDEPCPVYLELAAVDQAGERIFATGNLHTSSTTLSSVLLASDDGGKTWYEPHERLKHAGLDQIQFIDLEVGWIAGQVAGSLPRDPFFLLTGNGGKTWARRPVFSETRVGMIDQFWFESRTSGAMVVDRTQTGDSGGRHELYESMTGGESWSLREVSSKPIRLKRERPPEAAVFRVRAHGPSRSYRIEKRQGAQWAVVASFLVAAGECRPTEIPLAEPPPPIAPPESPAETPPPTKPRTPPTLKKKP